MLFMRSADDLHAKARIRDAAVSRFGQEGFGIGLRAIAVEAGVSPALIVHHFGSKAGLREACDEHVLRVVTEAKLDSVGPGGPEQMLMQLAAIDEYAPAAAYAVASLVAGGDLARRLVERMTVMTAEFLEAGVASGSIKPSRDPVGRARYQTLSGLGLLMVAYRLRAEDGEPFDLQAVFADVADEIVGPALELYTDGLFTDDSFLRAYESGLESHSSSDHTGDVS